MSHTALISHTPSSFVTLILNVCYIYSSTCCISSPGGMCVCLCVRRADGQCNLSPLLSSVLLAGVWHERAVGHGNQRGVMTSHPRQALPLVWVVGICLIYSPQQLGAPFPRGHLEKERGSLLQIWPMWALGGRSRSVVATSAATVCCLTAWDNRRCGMGVWYGLWWVCMCMCVIVYPLSQIYASHLVDWLISLRCWLLKHCWVLKNAHNLATSLASTFMGWSERVSGGALLGKSLANNNTDRNTVSCYFSLLSLVTGHEISTLKQCLRPSVLTYNLLPLALLQTLSGHVPQVFKIVRSKSLFFTVLTTCTKPPYAHLVLCYCKLSPSGRDSHVELSDSVDSHRLVLQSTFFFKAQRSACMTVG